MYYYKRHIGDYAKKAGHLSALEHGVYNLIIDSYYDREQAPTMAEAMRWARARSEDEKAAVLVVLSEFFKLDGEQYRQKRIDEELDAYHVKGEKNREIALAREAARREANERAAQEHGLSTNLSRNEHETCTLGSPNHKPITINHNKEQPLVPPDGLTLDKPDSSKTKVQASDADYDAARWIFGCNTKVNPSARQPTSWNNWANEIRLMREVDGYSHRQICELYQWAKADKFWSPNIQSPAALRKQWDKLAERKISATPIAEPKVKDWI